MHIAGGFYREQCCVPEWNAELGSGGRAAAALSTLSPGSILHTYADDFESEGIASLKELGVEIRLSPRPSLVVFSYFHPLSRPHMQPQPDEIQLQAPINVTGKAVLRFGFMEGEAFVEAERAVYDPQTWRNPVPFGANGSVADELAIVLNELELRSATNNEDLHKAAMQLMEEQNAVVVVAKGGIKGATVFERGGKAAHIPAYRSSRVFKIGTGDVFSAIFAHYWAEKTVSAVDSADIASRSVAAYCNEGCVPFSGKELYHLMPVNYRSHGSVLLEGAVKTLGQRYTMEEARYVLRELGVDVVCPALDSTANSTTTAALVVEEGLDPEAAKKISAKVSEISTVILREGAGFFEGQLFQSANVTFIDDFVSSLYLAAWASVEGVQ